MLGHFAFAINSFEPVSSQPTTNVTQGSTKAPGKTTKSAFRQLVVEAQNHSKICQNMSFNLRQLFKNQRWSHGQHKQIYLAFIQWANYCLAKFVNLRSSKSTSSFFEYESIQLTGKKT